MRPRCFLLGSRANVTPEDDDAIAVIDSTQHKFLRFIQSSGQATRRSRDGGASVSA
jgi:hypothetical protein